jgi:hypothetical protein
MGDCEFIKMGFKSGFYITVSNEKTTKEMCATFIGIENFVKVGR